MNQHNGILNVEVVDGPTLRDLMESGLDLTICVFKLSNGEWLEGFVEHVDYNDGKAIVRVRNAHDDREYLVAYNTGSTKGRVLEAL